ncbi:MAG: hypothetical protein ACJZ9F_04305 [Rhodospirillaceae bacterium]
MTDKGRIEIPRSAKGKRPQYFEDAACDKLHFMIMALIGELSVTRDRLDTLERVLERRGISSLTDIDEFEPTDRDELERSEQRKSYVQKIMKCFADEAAQAQRADPAIDFEKVVKVVSE